MHAITQQSLLTTEVYMNSSFAISPPAVQTMSDSDLIHARNMAEYHIERREFEASPCRRNSALMGKITGTAGTLGILIASPIVSAKLGASLASTLTASVSAACCVACCIGISIAKEPCVPRHPDLPQSHD